MEEHREHSTSSIGKKDILLDNYVNTGTIDRQFRKTNLSCSIIVAFCTIKALWHWQIITRNKHFIVLLIEICPFVRHLSFKNPLRFYSFWRRLNMWNYKWNCLPYPVIKIVMNILPEEKASFVSQICTLEWKNVWHSR